jgi:glycosyltransferase involved in cell wall biosynthesis
MQNGSHRIDYSVAIPAYGDPRLLADTLRHALAQRRPEDMKWEILVNDDGSEPPLEAVLGEFRGRVRFERNAQRQGWPENWNKTLEKARGTWVHMLHSDDLVHEGFATKLWELIRKYPQAAYLHSKCASRVLKQPAFGRLYSRLRSGGQSKDAEEAARVYRKGVEAARHALSQGVRIVTIVVRRDAAMSIAGFRKELWSMADEEYVVRLANVGDVVYCPQALCTYTYHSAQYSLSTWLEPDFLPDYLHVHEEGLKALGPGANDVDREAIHWRVACVACGVARARALAGNLSLARETLDDAVRLSPKIEETTLFRHSKRIVNNRAVRFLYRCLIVGGKPKNAGGA